MRQAARKFVHECGRALCLQGCTHPLNRSERVRERERGRERKERERESEKEREREREREKERCRICVQNFYFYL